MSLLKTRKQVTICFPALSFTKDLQEINPQQRVRYTSQVIYITGYWVTYNHYNYKYKSIGSAKEEKQRKAMKAEGKYGESGGVGGGGVALQHGAMFGNLANLERTFSNSDVDDLSHLELRERRDCPVLALGPAEEAIVVMGKALLLHLGEEGVCLLKVDL